MNLPRHLLKQTFAFLHLTTIPVVLRVSKKWQASVDYSTAKQLTFYRRFLEGREKIEGPIFFREIVAIVIEEMENHRDLEGVTELKYLCSILSKMTDRFAKVYGLLLERGGHPQIFGKIGD
jgi:hypothetical protein